MFVQRYYDPQIGRFLSVDPVTAYSMPGANFNRYWYANNNPYRFFDVDGRLPSNPDGEKSPCYKSPTIGCTQSLSTDGDGDQGNTKPVSDWTDADWKSWQNDEASRVLNAIGSPFGILADAFRGEWGEATLGVALFAVPEGRGLRAAYVAEVRGLEDFALNARAAGATPESVARMVREGLNNSPMSATITHHCRDDDRCN